MHCNITRIAAIFLSQLAVFFYLADHVAHAESDFTIVATRHKTIPRQMGVLATSVASQAYTLPADIIPGYSSGHVPGVQKPMRGMLSARSAIVLDSRSGDILYAHAPDIAGQPASTIKILTGLIAIRSLEMTDKVLVSRKASEMPRSKVDLQAGEEYPVGDLIHAVLLASANDASVALAEEIAGSERLFATLMTYEAKKMGATETVCKTATGLTAAGQKSTVRDLAFLFNKAMENAEFAGIMSSAKIVTEEGVQLQNHNKALWRLFGAAGGKTGFTKAAKQTYVGKFCREDVELVVALMGSEKMWDDLQYLVTYGFSQKRKLGENDSTSTRVLPLDL